jgi:Bacterial regulatory proteins, tetR family
MIQTEALRLFIEKGYAETTVEELADATAISPRTFLPLETRPKKPARPRRSIRGGRHRAGPFSHVW